MNVSLTTELTDFVAELVASGRYRSASEVVRAALRCLQKDEDLVTGLLWASVGMIGGVSALIAGQLRTTGREKTVMALGMITTALAAWPIALGFGIVRLGLGLLLVGVAAGPLMLDS